MDAQIESVVADALGRAAHAPTIWVGCSGGMDSTVLLHVAAQLAPQRVAALHVDHGLDAQSAAWSARCRRQADALGVRFAMQRVHIAAGPNLEARARGARYSVFQRTLEDGDVLLLAHHADDQLETMLLRLLRGTDTGRLGMPVERSIGVGRIIRPLLAIERTRIEAMAMALDLDWVEDPSNATLHADRNFLRHQIVSAVRQRWPDAALRAARSATRSQVDAEIVLAALDAKLGDVPTLLPVGMLTDAWAHRLLRRWLERSGVDAVREAAIEEILAQVHRSGAVGIEVLPGVFVRRHDDALHVVEATVSGHAARPWDLAAPVQLQGGVLRARRRGNPALVSGVTIEPWCGGERVRLPGRQGSRRVARLLQEHRIAAWQRSSYPLVFVDRALAVVPGVAVDAAFIDSFAVSLGTDFGTGQACEQDDVWVIEYETKPSAHRAFRL